MTGYLSPKPQVFVSESTGRWAAAIAREFPAAKVTRSLNLTTLQTDCREIPFSAAVIEIELVKGEPAVKDIYSALFHNRANSSTRYFAATSEATERAGELHNDLMALGFAAVFSGIGGTDRLIEMLGRHFKNLQSGDNLNIEFNEQDLEQLVSNSLPW